jgi:hypothetical protein
MRLTEGSFDFNSIPTDATGSFASALIRRESAARTRSKMVSFCEERLSIFPFEIYQKYLTQ